MHTCKDAIDLLLSYLDGEMTAEVKAKLEEHLGSCNPCVEFLQSYKDTPSVCRKALETKMPSELANNLTDFLRSKFKG